MCFLTYLFFVLTPVAKGKEKAAVFLRKEGSVQVAWNVIIRDVELPLYSDELRAHPSNTVT